MGNCFSASTADTDPSPRPPLPRSGPPPQPEPAPESSQYDVPASTPPQNVREKVDDQPSEPGPARAHAAPASYHRSRSKSAHTSLRPEQPPHRPSPPSVRPRAMTESNRPGRSKFENPSSNVPQNFPQPIPRTNRKSAPNDSGRRQFTSTVWSVLSDNFRFRILVVGKSRSGKSSLINSIFKVNTAVRIQSPYAFLPSHPDSPSGGKKPTPGNADFNVGFSHPDNSRLIVHEFPGFEPGYAQNLQTIRDFIAGRTDANLPLSERLHAIWICVPSADLIDGRLGDGVEEILGTQKVPVVLVFTKFDLLVSQVLLDTAGGDPRYHEHAKARAQDMCEESCRRLLRKHPRDVPAEIVSTRSRFDDLISKLFATTHRLVAADSLNASVLSTSFESQRGRPQVSPVALAWSIAQRVSRDVKLQASIVHGWAKPLGSSREFAGRTLEYCIDIIHTDIVDVWNIRDQNKYLSNREFKAQMSHLVKDLAVPHASASPSSNLDGVVGAGSPTLAARWVKDSYQNSTENMRCIMGYIVDLTVIQHELFQSARDLSTREVRSVMERHDKSGPRTRIHNDIFSFVTGTAQLTYRGNDVILEKTIDLIAQSCNSPPGSS
ncbi:hypothetical protein BJV78DRAFT_1286034 [Lactifluus subvellereus]|nr:hypothetical protein BJV78DRAFT_1286034 [Lactifluus subvellereus]